jgi:hypothetical protein
MPRAAGTDFATKDRVVLPLVFLGLGIICALISRILLLIAAIDISVWWALGIFLPFGPSLFRMNYPEEARPSMWFRYATLPCFGAFLLMGPALSTKAPKWRSLDESSSSTHLVHYAVEKPATPPPKNSTTPTPAPTPSLEERRAANATELQRLQKQADALRLRKRDLLHSDKEGNRVYAIDLSDYNEALTKATAEKTALRLPPQPPLH